MQLVTPVVTQWTSRVYTRNSGRQKTRWRDDLDKFEKKTRIAEDRQRWRRRWKARVQQRTFQG